VALSFQCTRASKALGSLFIWQIAAAAALEDMVSYRFILVAHPANVVERCSAREFNTCFEALSSLPRCCCFPNHHNAAAVPRSPIHRHGQRSDADGSIHHGVARVQLLLFPAAASLPLAPPIEIKRTKDEAPASPAPHLAEAGTDQCKHPNARKCKITSHTAGRAVWRMPHETSGPGVTVLQKQPCLCARAGLASAAAGGGLKEARYSRVASGIGASLKLLHR